MTNYFEALERELVDAAARQQSPAIQPASSALARRIRRPRRVVAVTAAILLGIGGPAAAVTAFKPQKESDGLVRLSEKHVIAQGTIEVGKWQLVAYNSDAGFCLSIRLPAFPSSSAMSEAGGCGPTKPGSLVVATSSGGSEPTNAVVWGMAPDAAADVRIHNGDLVATFPTFNDNAGIDGRFYVAELPTRRLKGPVNVEALSVSGEVVAQKSFR